MSYPDIVSFLFQEIIDVFVVVTRLHDYFGIGPIEKFEYAFRILVDLQLVFYPSSFILEYLAVQFFGAGLLLRTCAWLWLYVPLIRSIMSPSKPKPKQCNYGKYWATDLEHLEHLDL